MKTWTLLLLSLVPTVAGKLSSHLLYLRLISADPGPPLDLLIPWGVAAFCLWLGMRCGQRGPSFLKTLALTQWPSVVSLCLYVWQIYFVPVADRSLFWAALSQNVSASMLRIAGLIATLLTTPSSYAWSLLIHILSLLLLAALFSAGYRWGHTRAGRSE